MHHERWRHTLGGPTESKPQFNTKVNLSNEVNSTPAYIKLGTLEVVESVHYTCLREACHKHVAHRRFDDSKARKLHQQDDAYGNKINIK